MISFHFLIIFEQNDNRNFFQNCENTIQSWSEKREDEKSGRCNTIHEPVSALYAEIWSKMNFYMFFFFLSFLARGSSDSELFLGKYLD